MTKRLRIGTRDSQLAVWQATRVQQLLTEKGIDTELVYMKSEGDIDLVTPLYAMGVQGVFTKTLDAALLNNRIDIAVHSMKDVPTQLAQGIQQVAVLERASFKDILVYKGDESSLLQELNFVNRQSSIVNESFPIHNSGFTIATSSVRRKAQWLHRYPHHQITDIRGNVNTRLRKLEESKWNGAIFAAAGLERIALRPEQSIDLDWMLPAPTQGAILIACRENDIETADACSSLNHASTARCTAIEKDFLRVLMGGCATPISALAIEQDGQIHFRGNLLSLDGKEKIDIEKMIPVSASASLGVDAANELLANGGKELIATIRNA